MANKRPAYIPECWDNDTEMNGLMSYLKARHTNPTNYDRVIEFWKNLISDYCIHENTCVFTLDELKIKFRRGTHLPSPLSPVISELARSETVVSKDDLEKRNKGWIQWGASLFNPTTWFKFNSNFDTTKLRLVHLPVLKKLAKDLLEYYRNNYESSECPEVVAFDELCSKASHIVNKECFGLVVDELIQMGDASLGYSKDGERVLKFKDQSTKGPARFTEIDANVHDLRRTMNRLDLEIHKAEQKEQMFKEEARASMARKDKKAALNIMRKVARIRKELQDKDIQYQRLLGMLEQLAQTKQTKEIIEVYKAGSKAFKETLARQGLTPESIDVTVENVNEILQDYQDIEETIRGGFRNLASHSGSVDEAELESELNELLEEAEEEKAKAEPAIENRVRIGKRILDFDLPEVPSGLPNGNETALEERWKRLRMTAN